MKLSIVIPVYNTEKYLEKCLASCVNQEVEKADYEIVVVDDGTKDNAMAIALRYQENYPNIKIFSQENAGLSAARNMGLSHCSGDYVWFVDSDDYIEEGSLSLIFNKIEENPDVICIQAKRSDEKIPRNRFSDNVKNGFDVLLHSFDDWDRCVPYFIFNRQFIDNHQLRFYVGIFHEDDEFTPRALVYAEKVSVIDRPLYYYWVKTENTITKTVNPKKSYDNIIVAESLSDFKEKNAMPDNVKQVFENHISLIINNTLDNINQSDKQTIREFNRFLRTKKYLFRSLRKSNKLKYKLEYVLFSVSCNYVGVYNFIQNFNRR
ncbi:MAG: glycosyltransferase [Bacteroidales bacterium]|nr:glycosyltransferase [Bacteroidales bacterium]